MSYLQTAGLKSIKAHELFSSAYHLEDSDPERGELRQRAAEAWDEAEADLRMHGMYCGDQGEQQEGALTEQDIFTGTNLDLSAERAKQAAAQKKREFYLDIVIKIINRIIVAGAIYCLGYLSGFSAHHMTADEYKALVQQTTIEKSSK